MRFEMSVEACWVGCVGGKGGFGHRWAPGETELLHNDGQINGGNEEFQNQHTNLENKTLLGWKRWGVQKMLNPSNNGTA